MDNIEKSILEKVADIHKVPEGAYNIRTNGKLGGRNTTANIDIVTKEDKPGIDIIVKAGTRNESIHIPVVLSQSGLKDMVLWLGAESIIVVSILLNMMVSTAFLSGKMRK